jgi:hypothetical protein
VHFAKITSPDKGKWPLAIMLLCFTPLTLIGAFVSWVWIPDVQDARGQESKEQEHKGTKGIKKSLEMPPRPLEEITANPTGRQIFGLENHLRHLVGWDLKDEEETVPLSTVVAV